MIGAVAQRVPALQYWSVASHLDAIKMPEQYVATMLVLQDASKRPGTKSLLALKSVREHAKELDIELPPLPGELFAVVSRHSAARWLHCCMGCAATMSVQSLCPREWF